MGLAIHAIRMSAPSAGASVAGSSSKASVGREFGRAFRRATGTSRAPGCAKRRRAWRRAPARWWVGAQDGDGAALFDCSGAAVSDTDMSVQWYYSLHIDDYKTKEALRRGVVGVQAAARRSTTTGMPSEGASVTLRRTTLTW